MAVAEAAAAASAAGPSASVADDAQPACDDSACSTPFVSAPSSPTRDREYPSHFFFSAPTSPTRKDATAIPGGVLDFDFDFDFSSRFPSPSAAAMSSADELFHNGQIRPVRLAAALLQSHPDPAVLLDFPPDTAKSGAHRAGAQHEDEAEKDERGRVRSRSGRRKARSMSPFRTHWRSASHAPAAPPEPECADEAQQTVAATPAASRSSSSSSTASSASSASSSSSSRGSRRWGGFLKDLLHRSKSDGGKTTHHGQHSLPGLSASAAPKPSASPSPAAAAKGRSGGTPGHHRGGGRRRSAHERLYEARRAEAEEMRRRTSLPYRQGLLLFGCIGLGNRSSGYGGAVHGLARGLNAAAAVSSRS